MVRLLGPVLIAIEALVLAAFHALGLILELFKTHSSIASWSYPEPGFFKIGTVPLYSGFMYAAVASYMCQAWRVLDLELKNYPPLWLSVPLAAGVYLNFFTRHFVPDVRWLLAARIVMGLFAGFTSMAMALAIWPSSRAHGPRFAGRRSSAASACTTCGTLTPRCWRAPGSAYR